MPTNMAWRSRQSPSLVKVILLLLPSFLRAWAHPPMQNAHPRRCLSRQHCVSSGPSDGAASGQGGGAGGIQTVASEGIRHEERRVASLLGHSIEPVEWVYIASLRAGGTGGVPTVSSRTSASGYTPAVNSGACRAGLAAA